MDILFSRWDGPFNRIRTAITLLVCILLAGCGVATSTDCHLTCELGIDQTAPLTVGELEDKLVTAGWMQENPDRVYSAGYGEDGFSHVLKTRSSFMLDGDPPSRYGTRLSLDITWVGGVNPNDQAVPDASIYTIEVSTGMTILETWLRYGIPESGKIWPFYFYTEEDLNSRYGRPCEWSQYYAYYDDGRRFFKAMVKQPILLNWWRTPVIEVYPIADRLDSARSNNKRTQMDHNHCWANRG